MGRRWRSARWRLILGRRRGWRLLRQRKQFGNTLAGLAATTPGGNEALPAGMRYSVPRIRDSTGHFLVATGHRVRPFDKHGPKTDPPMGLTVPRLKLAPAFGYVDALNEGRWVLRIRMARRDDPGRFFSAGQFHGVRASDVVRQSRACKSDSSNDESDSSNDYADNGCRYPPSDLHAAPTLCAPRFAATGDA